MGPERYRFARKLLTDDGGAALMEFAIALPLLVVFIVGIYDFSGAFNQKQKIQQAAQEGAIIAGAQPTSDIDSSNANPDSLQPVVTAISKSLTGSGVVPGGACSPATYSNAGLTWTYTISGCSSVYPLDSLVIVINRGWSPGTATPATVVGTKVTVSYPYHWKFNSVIQLLFPGASYASTTPTESASVHNQT
jgi:Flp pilus assembly protein TadG